MAIIKICVCGKEFEARDGKARFHSAACKKAHEKKEKPRQALIRRELKLLRQLLGVTDRLLECAEERMK